ncbi:MAG: Holliday junction resolvase RuvX [Deltaproteobacteria bacterium]|jgi:putative Holliday junction resolvase|nr:Holliday junction resolvase RuvX [Deltaproteobacteria bacterium]
MTTFVALDPGEKTVGAAVSDPTGTVARPLPPLARRPHSRFLKAVAELLEREGADVLVVGLPLLDGKVGPRAQAALALAHELRKAVNVPVATQDESFTTEEAWEVMRLNGVRGRRAGGRADGVAAALILERHLRRPGAAEGGPSSGDTGAVASSVGAEWRHASGNDEASPASRPSSPGSAASANKGETSAFGAADELAASGADEDSTASGGAEGCGPATGPAPVRAGTEAGEVR